VPIMLRGIEGIQAYAGFELGRSTWVEVSPEMIHAFASVTDDRDRIFADDERNRHGACAGSVANGYLLIGLMNSMLRDIYLLEATEPARVCGINRLRFLAPVPASSSIRLDARLISFDATEEGGRLTLQCTMECDASKGLVLEAEVVYRFMWSSRALEPFAARSA